MCLVLSRVQLFTTPRTAARQAPLLMGFSKQEYWSGLPFPSPGDLPNPGTEPGSPALQRILYRLSCQGSPSIQEWVAFPFSGGELPDPGIQPWSPALQGYSLPDELPGNPWYDFLDMVPDTDQGSFF